jgi:hypothetical protein
VVSPQLGALIGQHALAHLQGYSVLFVC